MEDRWRTRADPEWTAQYGVPEVHVVLFEPHNDRGGPRPAIAVAIPEASRQLVRQAIKQAVKRQARLVFTCDTRRQANQIANLWTPKLSPTHHRIAYERAEAAGWGAQKHH